MGPGYVGAKGRGARGPKLYNPPETEGAAEREEQETKVCLWPGPWDPTNTQPEHSLPGAPGHPQSPSRQGSGLATLST